jgi:hypothetical protein
MIKLLELFIAKIKYGTTFCGKKKAKFAAR